MIFEMMNAGQNEKDKIKLAVHRIASAAHYLSD